MPSTLSNSRPNAKTKETVIIGKRTLLLSSKSWVSHSQSISGADRWSLLPDRQMWHYAGPKHQGKKHDDKAWHRCMNPASTSRLSQRQVRMKTLFCWDSQAEWRRCPRAASGIRNGLCSWHRCRCRPKNVSQDLDTGKTSIGWCRKAERQHLHCQRHGR